MRRMQTVVSLAVVVALFLGAALLSLACNDRFLKEDLLNKACTGDSDCPVYLGCRAGACIPRCSGDGGCSVNWTQGTCVDSLCVVNTAQTGNQTCVPGGELLRSDVAPLMTSGSITADATHVYLSAQGSDSLGNARYEIKAYPHDGSAPVTLRSRAGSVFSPTPLYRSAGWLYYPNVAPSSTSTASSSGGFIKVAVPPVDGVKEQKASFADGASIVLATSNKLFLSDSTGIVRADGDTGTAETTPLVNASSGSATNFQAVGDRIYWAQNGKIFYAKIDAGAAKDTGVTLPDYAFGRQPVVFVGATAYFTSPNGTLLQLDTTSAGASPVSLFVIDGLLLTDGTQLFMTRNAPATGGYCMELHRIDVANQTTERVVVLGGDYFMSYSPGRVVLKDGVVYWANDKELRRFAP